MPTFDDVVTVRGLASDYMIDGVELTDAGIQVRGGGVVEYYGTAEEACAGIRASWLRREDTE